MVDRYEYEELVYRGLDKVRKGIRNFQTIDLFKSKSVSYQFPLVLPGSWRVLEERDSGYVYGNMYGVTVIAEVSVESDGREWLYLGVCRPDRKATLDEVKEIVEVFAFGKRAIVNVPEVRRYGGQDVNAVNVFVEIGSGGVMPEFNRV